MDGKKFRKAKEVDFSAGGGLFLMTGPIDDRMCLTCLKHLSLVCTSEEWETIELTVFNQGLHPGCRCSWRSVYSIDSKLQEMQNTIGLQMDVEKLKLPAPRGGESSQQGKNLFFEVRSLTPQHATGIVLAVPGPAGHLLETDRDPG